MPTPTDVLTACLRLAKSLYGPSETALTIRSGTAALTVREEEVHNGTGRDPVSALESLFKAMRGAADEKLEEAREAHRKAAEAAAAAKVVEETLAAEIEDLE